MPYASETSSSVYATLHVRTILGGLLSSRMLGRANLLADSSRLKNSGGQYETLFGSYIGDLRLTSNIEIMQSLWIKSQYLQIQMTSLRIFENVSVL